MFNNPFSPIFGGKPDVFFGRTEILKRFDFAMMDHGSDDRAMFFTGTRGSGKTALLEQLSIRAREKRRFAIDLGPEDTILQFINALTGYDETTTTINPQASVSVLGFGGGVSAGSVSKTKHIGRETLQSLVIEACEKNKHGVLVTVDEIQKVPMDDISSLCNAFQMASRKGLDIMLVVAGLPYAYKKIIGHEGCTYLRRASHEEIGLFTWEETEKAFAEAFSGVKGLTISKERIDELNRVSFGHPYLMQLLGYHLVLHINESASEKKHKVTEAEIEIATKNALQAYEVRALAPLVDELPDSEQKYLKAMSKNLDEDRLVSTSDIAKELGVASNKISRSRAKLIDNGIVATPEFGKLMFCVPYLANYVNKTARSSSAVEIARERRV